MKRNIIWFQIDSMRPEFLNLEAAEDEKNFLDKLVSSSHYFPNCITSAPFTIVSEVSIFTGLYPHVHGVDGWFKTSPESLKRNAVTFTDILKYEGYSTFCIYESAARAYVPPFSFDEYHMLNPGREWPMQRFEESVDPKFMFFQFSGIHDDCIMHRGTYTRQEFRNSVDRVSEKIEHLYQKYCKETDIIVVASDHGVRCSDEPEGDHSEAVTGRYLTDKTIKVFFSIFDNSKKVENSDNVMCRTIDIVPTLIEAANLSSMGCQGVSQWNKRQGVEYAFSQTGGMTTSPWRPDTWSVRSVNWKFILTQNGELVKKELYDLVNDPYETNNVISCYKDIARELDNVLHHEFFKANKSPIEVYKDSNYDYEKHLSARSYLFKNQAKILIKNLIYRYFHRNKLILKLKIKRCLKIL